MPTINEIAISLRTALRPLYEEREAAAIVSLYLQTRLQMPRHELALRGNELVDELFVTDIQRDVEKMAQGCPVQYVLGETEFYGLPFKVTPAVLIPRPETEELVQMIVQQYEGQQIKIWDVGTGSGCIAVSLAKMLPKAQVFATDISEGALQVASQNALDNRVGVTFARHDMADDEHLPFGNIRFDVIVSNPPYIPASDRASMHRNVVDYEPDIALFVPNDDKFRCYRALACIAQLTLVSRGSFYAETYHDFHNELTVLFHQHGFGEVQSIRDLNGKLRFVKVVKN